MATKKEIVISRAMKRFTSMVEAYGVRETARKLGLSPGYVCEIRKGTRSLGPKAQAALKGEK